MPNFRYAIRSLGKSPLFTAVTIVSLGLALAVNTTMFALLDGVRHPDSPFHDDGRAISIGFVGGGRNGPSMIDRFRALQTGLHSADTVVAYSKIPATVQVGNTVEDHYVGSIPSKLFDILGVRPAVGRAFTPADEQPAAVPVAMISYTLWLRLFHEQPLNKRLTISIERGTFDVVGVMPRGMHFPGGNHVWVPQFKTVGDSATKRVGPFALVRLRPGVTIQMATSEANVVAGRLTAAMSLSAPLAARVSPIAGDSSPRGYLRAGGTMLSVVSTVLLIACANLGTMLLARGMARRREIAVRIALGARRRAIVGQVLAESTVIVGAGVALGAMLTMWAVWVLPHFAVQYVPEMGDMRPTPSWRVFLFAVAAAVVTLIAASVLPALRAAAIDPAEPIKEGAGSTSRLRDRYNPLIIIEVALSTALLMTAALFLIFVIRLVAFDFSYAAKQLQVARVEVRPRDVPSDSATELFFEDLAERVRTLPGVRAAATSRVEKPDGPMVFAEQGKSGDHWMNLRDYSAVSPAYLSTLGIPIVDGRDFQPGDRGSETGVVIVDDSAARRLWPDLPSPVGRMIKLGTRESKRPEPAGAVNDTPRKTGTPGTYSKVTS